MQTLELVAGAANPGFRVVRHHIATAAELAEAETKARRKRRRSARVHRGAQSAIIRAMRIALTAAAGRDVSLATLRGRYGVSLAQAKRYRQAARALGLLPKRKGGDDGKA